MPFPEYIATRTLSAGGAATIESNRQLKIRATLRATKSLIWSDTGFQFLQYQEVKTSELGSEVTFNPPRTDLAGWKDYETKALIDVSAPESFSHRYLLLIEYLDEAGSPIGIPPQNLGPFVLPAGDGVYDIDKSVVTGTVAGDQVSIPDLWSQLVADAQASAAEAVAALIDSDAFIADKINDPESQTGTALYGTIGSVAPDAAAEAMANPESALQSATLDLIAANAVPPANVPYTYFIGADTGAARPDWPGPVNFQTTVEVKPTHIRTSPPTGVAPDTWAFVTADPLPDVLIWSDTFTRADGAVGTTEVGGLAYTPAGGGGWTITGGKLAPTTGSGAGYLIVENSTARTITRVKIDTQSAGYGSFAFRYVDINNRYVIPRIASGTQNYRLVKTTTALGSVDVRTTSIPMETGDELVIDDRVIGQLKISVFKGATEYVIFDETIHTSVSVAELATETKVAFYVGLMSTTAIRFDNVSVYRPA